MLKSLIKKANDAFSLKSIIFIVLLIAASVCFGLLAKSFYTHNLDIFSDLKTIILNFVYIILTISFLILALAFNVLLVKPFWVRLLANLASAIVILLFLGFDLLNGALALFYFLVVFSFERSLHSRIENQIKFSARPVFETQKFLLLLLSIIFCVSFAQGYIFTATENNNALPSKYVDKIKDYMNQQVEKIANTQFEQEQAKNPKVKITEKQKAEALEESKKSMDKTITEFISKLNANIKYIGIGLGVSLFFILLTIIGLFAWLPYMILKLLMSIFTLSHLVNIVTEKADVERITL